MTTIEAAIELNLIGAEIDRLLERERTVPERAAVRILAWEHLAQRLRTVELSLRKTDPGCSCGNADLGAPGHDPV